MKPLFKTTVVIWSEYNPESDGLDLSDLAHEAEDGLAYCSKLVAVRVKNPAKDPDWDGTEFFNSEEG
jgi:hypothetical protein